ncbi:MAG: hypothetical protein ABIP79_15925 [Chitinophagaceae bacterium]
MNPLKLLIAAAAGYGIYKYSKMTPEQKNDLKVKGKEFIKKNVGDIDQLIGKKSTENSWKP